ncbi:MAG: cytidylate kinase family protein [bacterium]
MENTYKNITVSGKVAVGTTTLSRNLQTILGWQHVNAGFIQREYDRMHNIQENMQGAVARPDDHEQSMEAIAKKMLSEQEHLVYEGWLSGFVAKDIPGVLKVLVYCSHDEVRVDRVMNRENVSVEDAKKRIKQREGENIEKWKKLYGNYDFWDPKYYDLAIDTYGCGPMESVGKVLDVLKYKASFKK